MRKNETGFGGVELLLIVVVIGLIVAVGWLFFDRQNSVNKQTEQTQQEKTSSPTTKTTPSVEENDKKASTPVATTETYAGDGMSFSYPKGWKQNTETGKAYIDQDTSVPYKTITVKTTDYMKGTEHGSGTTRGARSK